MLMFLRKPGIVVVLLLLISNVISAQATAEVALEHLREKMLEEGWSAKELASLTLSSQHHSPISSLTHFYFQQEIYGTPLMPGWASVHLDESGKVFLDNNQLVGGLDENLSLGNPALSATDALALVLKVLMPLEECAISRKSSSKEKQGLLVYSRPVVSDEIIVSFNPVYYAAENLGIRLSWNIIVPHDEDVWDLVIDAETGQTLSQNNWVHKCVFGSSNHEHFDCVRNSISGETMDIIRAEPTPAPNVATVSIDGQYNIFALPVESPLYGSRSLKLGTDIINTTASPNGWHDIDAVAPTPDYEYTRGNNVYAYYAPAGSNSFDPTPEAIVRTGGVYTSGNVPWPEDLDFNYTHSLNTITGTDFIEDAVTNLFAWNNMSHDVFYLYGFDEAAGNFQEKNFTMSGEEGDYVRARAQDGSGLNNATFFTPPEPPPVGTNPPYMRMFLWDTNLPSTIIDGDFDNLIITHEYGHGVSTRLVGGASTNACLTNFEQGGEGWSDFFGLMLTMADQNSSGDIEENVLGEGIRSVGTYVLAESANDEGVRLAYYTTNMDCTTANCNDFTYGDLPNVGEPHGVGFVWCTMLWEMTWELINEYGYETDIYNTASTAGNIRAMKIIIEGLKLTPCNPTFPQMRDAIISANDAIYGGASEDKIWAAFARRGLGYSASAGGNEAFDNPTMRVTKTVDKTEIEVGDELTYTLTVKNNSEASLTNVSISDPISANLNVTSISDGGSVQNGEVTYPAIPTIAVGGSEVRTFTAEVTGSSWTTNEYDNPIESAVQPDFTPAGAWIVDGGNPNSGSTLSWWHLDPFVITDASLILTLNLDGSKNNHLSFWQYFDLEPNIDGGVIEVLDGGNWEDLYLQTKKNAYNSIILDDLSTPIGVPVPLTVLSGRRAFSGYSGGYVQTIIDLSAYSGSTQIRFRLATDENNVTANCDATISGCDGWYLDDFVLYDLNSIQNTAFATSDEGFNESGSVGEIGTIFFEEGALPVELIYFEAIPSDRDILIKWKTASELENAGFELQRRSEREQNFETITWIEGQGNSTIETRYQFLDENVENGITYYYRLKQIDYSGSMEFSKVVSAKILSEEETIAVFPNPVEGNQFYIQLSRPSTEPFEVKVWAVHGQLISNFRMPPNGDLFQLDAGYLSSGIYLLDIRMQENNYQFKLVIP